LGINFHTLTKLNTLEKTLLAILSGNGKVCLFISWIKIVPNNNLVTIYKKRTSYIINTDIALTLEYQTGKTFSEITINFKTDNISIPIVNLSN